MSRTKQKLNTIWPTGFTHLSITITLFLRHTFSLARGSGGFHPPLWKSTLWCLRPIMVLHPKLEVPKHNIVYSLGCFFHSCPTLAVIANYDVLLITSIIGLLFIGWFDREIRIKFGVCIAKTCALPFTAIFFKNLFIYKCIFL